MARSKRARWLLPFIPWLFLAVDYGVFPILIETSEPNAQVTGVGLLSDTVQYLGDFKAHRIYVSLDDIDDPDYLAFTIKDRLDSHEDRHSIGSGSQHPRVGLATSITPQGEGWTGPELTRILANLASLSPEDHDGIIDLIRDAPPSDTVLWYKFKKTSPTPTSSLPLNYLVILKIQSQQRSAYAAEIREMLETASKKRMTTLVLPCLAKAAPAENANTLTCGATYETFFQMLQPGSPLRIFFSLDKNWPTETIVHEVDSIKETWKTAVTTAEKTTGPTPTLYQSDLRLMLLFLPVCLLVCSLYKELTFRNYAIISIGFGALGIEVQDKLTPMFSDVFESSPAWIFKCVLLAIVSGGFVFLSSLEIERFFKRPDGNAP